MYSCVQLFLEKYNFSNVLNFECTLKTQRLHKQIGCHVSITFICIVLFYNFFLPMGPQRLTTTQTIIRSNQAELDACKAINNEKDKSRKQFENRRKIFVSILSNAPSDDAASLKYAFYIFGSIIVVILPSFVFTLIPAHNVIIEPSYWYETPFQAAFSFPPFYVGNTLFLMSSYINVEFIKSHRHFQKIITILIFSVFAMFTVFNIAWTKICKYNLPIPFCGYIFSILIVTEVVLTIWYLFPRQWRKDKEFRNRLKATVTAVILNQFVIVPYGVINTMILRCPMEYQWIAALFLPLVREFMIWISIKWVKKASNGDFTKGEIVCNQAICSSHALMISYILGSIATVESSAMILAIDFIINLYITIKIIYLNKKRSMEEDKQVGLLQELVINEIVEFMVPPAYLATFVIAFYGPNAELIGNVRNGYWQFTQTSDIDHTIRFVVILFCIDLCSLLISAIFLWIFCRINLYRAFVEIQKEFGLAFMVQMAHTLTGVS